MPTAPPLTTFDGTVRQLDLDGLPQEGRVVFDFAFPVFNEAPTLNGPAQRAAKRGEQVERPYNYRRFAGGGDLPRGCYQSVCTDSVGTDSGTLALELTAYADPSRSGILYVFDGSDLGVDGGILGSFQTWRPNRTSIVVAFMPEGTRPHPLLDPARRPIRDRRALAWFRRTAPRSDRNVAVLEIPTKIRSIRHERVLDLRRPSAQEWLNSTVRNDLPFAVFVYPEPVPGLPAKDLKGRIPKDYPWVTLYRASYQNETIDIPTDAFASTGLRFNETDRGMFRELLAALVTPGRGGSALTEAIGTVIRIAGARGLVYASARNDIVCVFKGEEVQEHAGWCFVDYSAFELAMPIYRIMYDPLSWISGERLSFEVRPPEHALAGSWRLLGLRARTETYYGNLIEQWIAEKPDARLDGERRRWQFWK